MKKILAAIVLAFGVTGTATALDLTVGVGKCNVQDGVMCERPLAHVGLGHKFLEYQTFGQDSSVSVNWDHYSNYYDGLDGFGADLITIDYTVELF